MIKPDLILHKVTFIDMETDKKFSIFIAADAIPTVVRLADEFIEDFNKASPKYTYLLHSIKTIWGKEIVIQDNIDGEIASMRPSQ